MKTNTIKILFYVIGFIFTIASIMILILRELEIIERNVLSVNIRNASSNIVIPFAILIIGITFLLAGMMTSTSEKAKVV